ncbi:hypothetical protein [Saccharolobus sp. E5-1-F]|uniref:hypothetical protein n=1 Tax=Saccharolobus sp. E5-1-F TaxID=2663019 RepID=UPI0032E38D5D
MECPKTHDPGKILLQSVDRLPDWLKNEADNLAYISRWLRAEREPLIYGDEVEGLSPTELYTKVIAEKH